jgi:hypothetical protein
VLNAHWSDGRNESKGPATLVPSSDGQRREGPIV